ncbi:MULTISPECIES: LruC domain-containing protein [unclassified Lentimicrobium]|uniref:LruC domain-containing protein n=1 Tax=unclassified Lentimicrobium TaxID=2677434 RepID=UPI00155772A1|nr:MULTISPECIES: LruC domain-containing protein [unclassified Lentimicrobium]NPD46576.1 LruC domain-containing protein [Lentimicrobium sp. S6]NPD85719.1 LruC domain-containing protein [Lentimicrobium sp. L6]
MKNNILIINIAVLLLFFSSCTKKLEEVEQPINTDKPILNLDIPQDFSFETKKDVRVSFNDFKITKAGVNKYSIYLYTDEVVFEEVSYENEGGEMVTEMLEITDELNNVVTTVMSETGQFEIDITIPSYYEYLYIVKNDLGYYTSEIVPIINNKAVYASTAMKSTNEDPVDVIYGVNAQADLFTLNPVTGDFVVIGQLPSSSGGSVTCAIDPVSRVLYTIGSSSRKLYAYDIDNESWEERGYTGLSGPRLEYRKEDGLLYFSTSNRVQTVDPSNGNVISTFYVNGLHNSGWGDVAFDADGVLFMSTYSGLYRCDPAGGNTYDAVRISAENLPFNPTSMTFDSNGELWIGSISNGKGRVVVMDQITGGWEWRYQDLIVAINDLTYLPLDETQVQETDSDGDGIIDFYDEYPNDGDKAYNVYTPSIYGWGSYAFEDLWPYQGDYDFNDLIINYRVINIANSNDEIVETEFHLQIKNVGGSFHNGFGIELGMEESLIESFSTSLLTEGIVTLNAKGLEVGQAKPVIIPFDDAWDQVNSGEMVFILSYNNPIQPEQFGNLNPFIFINGERGREVHFADFPPTSLVNTDYFGTADDDSSPNTNRYYKNTTNLPWGIDIIHDFIYLQEKEAIINGYNKFANWAESGGIDYPDWYKNQDGYRNDQYLVY